MNIINTITWKMLKFLLTNGGNKIYLQENRQELLESNDLYFFDCIFICIDQIFNEWHCTHEMNTIKFRL